MKPILFKNLKSLELEETEDTLWSRAHPVLRGGGGPGRVPLIGVSPALLKYFQCQRAHFSKKQPILWLDNTDLESFSFCYMKICFPAFPSTLPILPSGAAGPPPPDSSSKACKHHRCSHLRLVFSSNVWWDWNRQVQTCSVASLEQTVTRRG